jgi:long-chain fatty acid transport protein
MRKIAGVLVAGCLTVASPAFATNGMRMIGFGAVQDSMGGVGVGATLDGSSLLSNPAGITDLGWRFDLSGGYFQPNVSYKASGLAPPIVATNQRKLSSDRGGSPIPAIAYVHPLNDRLAAGVGVFGVAGMGVDYKANLYGGTTLTSYLQGRLTPGAAYRLTDKLSVGLTANVMMAQMEYEVAGGAGQAKHDTANSFGIGATVGVKYSPVKMVTLGAAYETKSLFQEFEFDVPARPNPFAPPGTMFAAGTDKLDFDQPATATIGVSVTPVEMLLLAADVQWINWSDTMGDDLPEYTNDVSPTTGTGSMPFDMGWDDQWVLKLGAQLAPMPGLKIRAGYNYGAMPLDPSRAFENLAFPAVAEHHLTAGVGYEVNPKWTVNVAGMYAFNAKLEGANGSPPPPMGGTGQGITSYTTEMSQFEIDLGVAYRF